MLAANLLVDCFGSIDLFKLEEVKLKSI